MNFDMDTIMESILDDIDEMILQKRIEPPLPHTTDATFNPSSVKYHITVNPIDTSIDPWPLDTALNSAVCTDTTENINHSYDACNAYNNTPVSNTSNVSTPISVSNSAHSINTYTDNTNIISKYKPLIDTKLQLKYYVFISRDSTRKLAEYIVTEQWGNTYSLLYKYLDYIFRCQLFGKQVIQINDPFKPQRRKYLIFNCGLQRKSDNEILYALFTPNNIIDAQQWRVPFGHIKHSFLTKKELINKLTKQNIKMFSYHLPKRTKFYNSLNEILYDSSYSITANWEERLSTNKDRIFSVIGNDAFFDGNCKFLKLTELIECFMIALPKTQNIAELNPRLAVPQAFVDSKHGKYRLELLLPIIISFPKYNGNYYKFVLAIGKSEQHKTSYVVKSLLTMDMAYANARLVGYVDSLWLHYGHYTKSKNNINDFCINP